MQDKNDHTRNHRFTCGKVSGDTGGSSPSFQELEEGCDQWVTELRSILQTQENALTVPCVRQKQEDSVEKHR
jgi:hypothetical protein